MADEAIVATAAGGDSQAIEQAVAAIGARIESMKVGTPAETEQAHQWVKEQCADARLPADFKRQALEKARAYDCDANMRATDAALAEAARLAAEERMQERGVKLGEARMLYGKACQLGANDYFRKATGRLIETIMLTGGVYKPGVATKAKPADTAPRAPTPEEREKAEAEAAAAAQAQAASVSPEEKAAAEAAERAKKEADAEAARQMMVAIRERVEAMRAGTPADTEQAHQWVKEQCADPRLSVEFKRVALEKARAYDCDANMRATDAALAAAVRLAAAERLVARAAKLGEARKCYGKACQLGADEEFRKATGRLIETAMMTGGVYKPGAATKAKPGDPPPTSGKS